MITVSVNGCFDVLHSAHIRLLKKASQQGESLTVLMNSDSSVRRLKGKERPINNQHDRKEMLEALACVDKVIIFNELTPLKALAKLKPSIHVKGGKYDKIKTKEEQRIVEKYGGYLMFMPLEKGYSSTNIINKLIKEEN